MAVTELDSRPELALRLPPWLRVDRIGLILLTAITLAYAPLLIRLSRWLWNRDHYSFFPLALVAVISLVLAAFQTPGSSGQGWIRKILLTLAVLSLLAAMVLVSPWLCGVSAMILVLGLTYAIGGTRVVTRVFPGWLLLWVIIPLPLSLDRELILSLQHVATRFSSGLLDLLGYRHVPSGVVLRLPDRIYHVEEACSGIHSLFSTLFCAGFYLILNQAGIIRAIIILSVAFFWVMIANIARITSVVALKESFDLPVDVGFYHAALGFFFFALTMIAVFCTERMVNFIWPTLDPPYWVYRSTAKDSGGNWRPKALSDCLSPAETCGLIGVFGLATLIQIYSIATGGALALPSRGEIPILAPDSPVNVPEGFQGWRTVDYRFIDPGTEEAQGVVSRLWLVEKDGMSVEMSVDGPYINGWHYLSDCYRGQGWKDSNERYIAYRDIGEDLGGDFLTFDLAKPSEEFGLVVTGLFDRDCRAFIAPDAKRFQRHYGRVNDFKEKLAALFGGGDPTVARSDALSYQIQVFYHAGSPVTETQRKECVDLFHSFRKYVAEQTKS